MFTEYPLVYVFFRFLNASIIVALVVYLFKRYVVDMIKEQMREKELQTKNNVEQQKVLAQEEEMVRQRAQEQELFAQRLEKNLQTWRTYFDAQALKQAQEKGIIREKLAQKSALQQKHFVADTVADAVLVRASEQAHKELQKEFADEHKGKAYVHDIVAYLKKRSL
jgi:hypothetical protein